MIEWQQTPPLFYQNLCKYYVFYIHTYHFKFYKYSAKQIIAIMISIGANTSHHDQLISPNNFNVIKINVRISTNVNLCIFISPSSNKCYNHQVLDLNLLIPKKELFSFWYNHNDNNCIYLFF